MTHAPTPSARRLRPRVVAAAAIAGGGAILACLLLVRVALVTAPTSDEAAHLTSGVSYLATGDYRMNPEHPPLMKLLAAWPVWVAGADPPVAGRDWDTTSLWRFGDRFMSSFGEAARSWLALGRVLPILVALLLVVAASLWSTHLFGPWGGAVTAVVAALDPTLLGHGCLVTTDIGFSLLWLGALAAFLAVRRKNTVARRLGAGVILGLALATQFSASLLVPLAPVVIFYPGLRATPAFIRDAFRSGAWRNIVWTTVVIVAVAFLVVTAVYEGNTGLWFQGLAVMRRGAESYLLGQRQNTGWLWYFVVALAIKVPPGTWALALGGGAAALTRPPRDREAGPSDGAFLAGATLLFFVMASLSRFNIGVRHVAPVPAALWILAGGVVQLAGLRPLRRAALALAAVALLAWNALELRSSWPTPLAYGSSLTGGPAATAQHLADSNVDWGQGLIALAEWQRRQPADVSFALVLFSNANLADYGVRGLRLPAYGPVDESEPRLIPRPSARLLLAISATNLQGFGLEGRDLYGWLRDRTPVAWIAHAIAIFDMSAEADRFALAAACRTMGWRRTSWAVVVR